MYRASQSGSFTSDADGSSRGGSAGGSRRRVIRSGSGFSTKSAYLRRIDVQPSANLLRQHCAAHVAVPVAAGGVEAERWVSIAVFVPLWIEAAPMQPVAVLLEASPCQRPRDFVNHTRVERRVTGRRANLGRLPFPHWLARLERLRSMPLIPPDR